MAMRKLKQQLYKKLLKDKKAMGKISTSFQQQEMRDLKQKHKTLKELGWKRKEIERRLRIKLIKDIGHHTTRKRRIGGK